MNRFGKLVLGLLLLGAIGLAALIRINPADAPERAAPPVADGPPVLPSGLAMPVAGVEPGALADTFGQARDGGERAHGALDIMAARGTPVVAAAAGRVEKIFESDDGGHTVYVRSPDGRWVFYYAHLDTYSPALREGLAVARGQAIGTVGSSGNASPDGPHLHFEIKAMRANEDWHEGRAINPYPLLAGAAEGG